MAKKLPVPKPTLAPPGDSLHAEALERFVTGEPPRANQSTDNPVSSYAGKLVRRERGPAVKAVMVYMPPELAIRLRTYCVQRGTPASSVVNGLVQRFLDEQAG